MAAKMENPEVLLSVVIPIYRDAARALESTFAVLNESLPINSKVEVIAVDDGSNDGTSDALNSVSDKRLRVLTLPSNMGRSEARNRGAQTASGEIVIFLDCDCIPERGFLAAHLDALSNGAIASTGHVTGIDNGFWSRYQVLASERRKRKYDAGTQYVGTSSNLAVKRSVFQSLNGFDTGYRKYGFEDRDFLIRVADLGQIAWADDATVQHRDALTLSQVSEKMREVGTHSSILFSSRHPNAYEELGYASIDVEKNKLARVISPLCTLLTPILAKGFDQLHCESWLPFPISAIYVKTVSAMSFVSGTAARPIRMG